MEENMKKSFKVKTLFATLMFVLAALVMTGCGNPNGGDNQNGNNNDSAIETIAQKETDYNFIYEIVNKSAKKITVYVFVSDNAKYAKNPDNPDAAIVAKTEEVELAPNENHEFKIKVDTFTSKYGTGTCFGLSYTPEDGSRSRGWMNGSVYGKGRKHTVTINEYFNGVNSWSFLPDNPMINVHGYWEGSIGDKQAFIRLCSDGNMSLITYNVGTNGNIVGCNESDGSWTCDNEKIYADYFDVITNKNTSKDILYTTGTNSIELTIDGVKSTWTASTTFEVDEWSNTTNNKWSDFAEEKNGKYVYYCYGFNKLPKEYWDYEDSNVCYKTGETAIEDMYYESCVEAIETALNNGDFYEADYYGPCLVLNENPQSQNGSSNGENQEPVTSITSDRLLLEAVEDGIKVTVIGDEGWGQNTWLSDNTSDIDIFIKNFDSEHKFTFVYPFTEEGKNYKFQLHNSSSGTQHYYGDVYTITATNGSGYPMSDAFTNMTLALSHNDAGEYCIKFNTTATKFSDFFRVDMNLLTNGKQQGSPSLGAAIFFGYPGNAMVSYSNIWMYFDSVNEDCVSGFYRTKNNTNVNSENLFETMQSTTFETNVFSSDYRISDFGNVYCSRPDMSIWCSDADIYYSIRGKYTQRYEY